LRFELVIKTNLGMRIFGILLCLLLGTLVSGQGLPDLQQQHWNEFRQLRPYSFQFVVWESQGGSGTIIISEPPAALDSRQINRVLRKMDLEGDVFRVAYEWGQGGRFFDLVVQVPSTNPQQVEQLAIEFAKRISPSSAPQRVCRLPQLEQTTLPATTFRQLSPIDLLEQIDLGKEWTSEAGQVMSISQLLAQENSDLFHSNAGEVALLLSRSDLDKPTAWEPFLSATDLLLAGTWTETHVLILGRKRMIPTNQLEPLRAATVAQLVTLPNVRSLLESRNPLSGQIEPYRFWAPWFLSPGLEDSELGALLLWSESARLTYLSQGRYRLDISPLPKDSISAPVNETMVHTTPWTTEGAFYQMEQDSVNWLGRSILGGLPLKNLARNTRFWNGPPRKNPAAKVEIGFAMAQVVHPVFLRTSEYAFLFQLFRQAEIPVEPAEPYERIALSELAAEIFEEARLQEEENNWNAYAEALALQRLGPTFDASEPNMANLLVHTAKGAERELAGSAQLLLSTLDTLEVRHGKAGEALLAQALVLPAPYSFRAQDQQDSMLISDVTLAAQTLSNSFRILAGTLSDPVTAHDLILTNLPEEGEKPIITPRLVELGVFPAEGGTGQLGQMPWGGSSWPTWKAQVAVDDLQPPGQVRVELLAQGHRVTFHPDDLREVDFEVFNWLEKPLQPAALKRKIEELIAD
jgi:hypothetical protein